MKTIKIFIGLIIIGISPCLYADSFQKANIDYQVCFTPGGECTQDIVDAIYKAQSSILVQAYSFTSAPIAKALVEAHRRGIDVKVILDKSQSRARYSSTKFLQHAGIPTYIDYKPAIAHNKVMIIDGKTVITGSFNFTSAAQNKNAENLLIINNSTIAAQYSNNWQNRYAESKPADLYSSKLSDSNTAKLHFDLN